MSAIRQGLARDAPEEQAEAPGLGAKAVRVGLLLQSLCPSYVVCRFCAEVMAPPGPPAAADCAGVCLLPDLGLARLPQGIGARSLLEHDPNDPYASYRKSLSGNYHALIGAGRGRT